MTAAAKIAGVASLLAVTSMHAAISTGEWQRIIAALRPLHTKFIESTTPALPALTNDHGQTFEQYVESRPQKPVIPRRTICIQPLGMFGTDEWRVVNLTADFLRRFYGLPVRIERSLILARVPADAWATNLVSRRKELDVIDVLTNMLALRVPADACMYLCITTSAFWQCSTSVFMAGQAAMGGRVGMCSLAYSGRFDGGMSNLFLIRTLKVAAHECGHMLSLAHCTAFECCMCGLASGEDGTERPLEFCPECMAKLCWADEYDPRDRFQKLKAFCVSHGFVREADLYTRFFLRVYALRIAN